MSFASSPIGVDEQSAAPLLRAFPTSIQSGDFGPAVQAAGFPPLFPLISSGGKYLRWSGGTTQLDLITAASTAATAGTFTLTVNGKTTAPLDHDISGPDIEVALEDVGVGSVDDMIISDAGGGLGANNGSVTLFWSGGELAEQPINISADFSSLVGNVHVLSQIQAGDVDEIQGFVWPDNVMVEVAEDTIGNVMLAGRIHVDDIAVDASRNLGSIKASMRLFGRRSPYTIEGLERFA